MAFLDLRCMAFTQYVPKINREYGEVTMLRLVLMSLIGLIIFALIACGAISPADEEEAAAVEQATQAPTATQVPTVPPTEPPPMEGETLRQAAARLAGGPGAIYAGDVSLMVGPAPVPDLGGFDGDVPLEPLERHLYLYEHPFYQNLLDKANYTNPTELVSSGEEHVIQHASVNRALLPCILVQNFLAPNLYDRTNGQLEIQITSFPELGIAGPDVLTLVADCTLAMAQVYSGYIAGELPAIEIVTLWGVYPDNEITYKSQVSLLEDLETLVLDETGGVVINHNWFSGVEQYFICKERIDTLDDFKGKRTRSHSAALSDWINGMGAAAQFVAFPEVYTALERGILDCGGTGADPAYAQRWYEVTQYMNGPLPSFTATNNIVNAQVWGKLPEDLQKIFLEEGARAELEQLRLTAIQNEVGTKKNLRAGLELVQFSDEINAQIRVATKTHLLPGWLRRLGGPDSENAKKWVPLFNERVGSCVGLKIEADGRISEVPISKQ